jgi:hypothetical protein
MDVRSKTFKPTTITAAFRKSGCWPVNCGVFADEDYAPSIPTSTSTFHVPSSFPLATDTMTKAQVPDQDPDNDSDDDSPAYPMDDDDNSDDDSSNSDTPDAVNNDENSRTHTTSGPLPAESHSLLATTDSPQPPLSPLLASLQDVPDSTPYTPPSFLEHILSSTFQGLTDQPKQKRCPIGQPTTPFSVAQAHLHALSQAYSELEKENIKLHSENSSLKAHCTLAGTEIHNLRQQLSAKENRPQK